MKKFLYIPLFIFIPFVSFQQLKDLRGIWVSKNMECIAIKDTNNVYDDSNGIGNGKKEEGVTVSISGKILSFQKRYYTEESNFEKMMADSLNLKIIKSNEKILVLSPNNKLSKTFFSNQKKIIFYKQDYIDEKFTFEKLIFHSSQCYGSCPVIDFEIKNDRSFYLETKLFKDFSMFDIDTAKTGSFKGVLDQNLYNNFISKLNRSYLNIVDDRIDKNSENQMFTYILFYDGKKKYIQYNVSNSILDELNDFLLTFPSINALTKCDKRQEIIEK